VEFGHETFAQGNKLDAVEGELLVEMRHMLLVT
jgi:hypothetical protein